MMLVTMNAPNGLAGVYRLNPFNSVDLRLDSATLNPNELLANLATRHGIGRIYWLRLQSRGPYLWYVVKPTPYALAMVFDARTGARLDPLPDSLLAVVADEALLGGRMTAMEPATEYNRYYDVDRLQVVRATLAGAQSARLILSRDEGRTLRRLNAESERFEWWYRTFHVNQLSHHLPLWTTLLYACAIGVITLTGFGYLLFWWRRPRAAIASADGQRAVPRPRARDWHRKLGVLAGGILSVQVLIGGYLWLSLGPLEDPFRGKASFRTEWDAGFETGGTVATPAEVLRRVSSALPASPRPIQAIEWRLLGTQPVWAVTTRLDEEPRVFDATGAPVVSLAPAVAGEIARQEIIGKPSFAYLGASPQLWMDLNRPIDTYHFRFKDSGNTDVYVSQRTAQIIQRRPWFWRVFGPFLAVHTFAFTGNKTIDVTFLVVFQLLVLAMIATGWRVRFPGRRSRGT